MPETMPVFVKVDNYKDIIDTLEIIKERMERAKGDLAKIHDLKAKEDQELQQWAVGIDEMEAKLASIETTLSSQVKV
ncbi:hypothetical protein HZB01_01230 [Candidatus Woesearchaeota archaeon]|nr:hypothetical protein [Candidatus Woesearchaeota archaeon]